MECLSFIQLMHLCSSTFPVGAFSHSYGLEYMIEKGFIKNSEQFERYLKGILKVGFGKTELPIIKLIYENPEKITEYNHLCTAVKSTKELRNASLKLGKAFVKVFDKMYPGSISEPDISGINYSTAFAAACRYLGIPLNQAIQAYVSSTLMAYIQTGIKLIPLSQTDSQVLMKKCYEEVFICTEKAIRMTADDIFCFTPMTEISSMLHERQYSRMYMS